MKVVFAHDHIFRQDKLGNYYTAGAFNSNVWKRYLKHFEKLTVIARLSEDIVPINNKYNEFNLRETNFVSIPSISGPMNLIKNNKKAYNLIKEELIKADFLIARLPSEIGNLAVDIANNLKKPYIIEVVGCVWDSLWNYGSLQAKVYAPFAMYRMRKRVKNSPYIIYVTNEFLQNRYPTNGKFENISNVEIINANEDSLEKRLQRYKENKKLYTIGMIGSLKNKIKGLEVALKALSELNRLGIDYEFQILGDGDQQMWIEMSSQLGIREKVKFIGTLPGGDPVLNWLDKIDIYIQPSYQEGLPRAVIEAMSRGCPVIGSTAGGIPELINANCVHRPGDYAVLSEKLIDIMTDVEKAVAISIENYNNSKQYVSKILNKRRFIFFESLLEKNEML